MNIAERYEFMEEKKVTVAVQNPKNLSNALKIRSDRGFVHLFRNIQNILMYKTKSILNRG